MQRGWPADHIKVYSQLIMTYSKYKGTWMVNNIIQSSTQCGISDDGADILINTNVAATSTDSLINLAY